MMRLRLDRYDNSAVFERGAPKWKEALWMLCKFVFFLNCLPWPYSLRVRLLRLFGARIGEGVVIKSGVDVYFPWKLSIGDHVWIGEGADLYSIAPITIESQVCISQKAYLCTGSHDWRQETFDLKTGPITIRTSAWVAAGAFLGRGVEIGPGSVVSAYARVTRSVPANSVAEGNPAQVRPLAETVPLCAYDP